jgi:hypothetical protein
MTKPFTINLQINVYPDGTVSVNGAAPQHGQCSSPAAALGTTLELPSTTSESQPSTVSSGAASAGPSQSAEPGGPSESDVRTALLAAVKASDKATAVGVLEKIAGVARVPEVPAEKRVEVIAALEAIVASKA